jgi:hypothetical protein
MATNSGGRASRSAPLFEISPCSSSSSSSKPKLTENIFEPNEGGGLFVAVLALTLNKPHIRAAYFVAFSAFYFMY